MPVEGIGGVFFRAQDPKALGAWYHQHLGVGRARVNGSGHQRGPLIFAFHGYRLFSGRKAFMLNLRVSDLDGLLAGLRGAGIDIITKAEWDEAGLGRFARIHDPEGNAVELWEPAD
jgi:hypothetical protein